MSDLERNILGLDQSTNRYKLPVYIACFVCFVIPELGQASVHVSRRNLIHQNVLIRQLKSHALAQHPYSSFRNRVGHNLRVRCVRGPAADKNDPTWLATLNHELRAGAG